MRTATCIRVTAIVMFVIIIMNYTYIFKLLHRMRPIYQLYCGIRGCTSPFPGYKYYKAANQYVLPSMNRTVNWSDPIESCSSSVLKEYTLQIPDSYPLQFKRSYPYDLVPKRTFSHWLSHIESKRRWQDKSFFADKYRVKEYIEKYKIRFSYINYARLLVDDARVLSFDELVELKAKHTAFLIKPNHLCSKQIIVHKSTDITHELHQQIVDFAQNISGTSYKRGKEKHYELIEPRVFIEAHLNEEQSDKQNDYLNVDRFGNPMDDMIEYKMMVINYKCLFLYVIKKPYKNLYSRNLTLLNVHWGYYEGPSQRLTFDKPSSDNLQKMIQFSEHFAKRERFEFVRVDLYVLSNKIYFSEFTFTPMGGCAKMAPVAFDYYLYDVVCNASQHNLDRIYQFAF
eukprot:56407_1